MLKLLVLNTSAPSPVKKTMPPTQWLVSSSCHGLMQLHTLQLMVGPFTASNGARYWRKITVFCLPHLHSMPTFGRFPSEYCHNVWYGKTIMAWLPDSEKFFENTITNFDRIHECGRQTDRQMDRHRMTVQATPMISIARQKLKTTN